MVLFGADLSHHQSTSLDLAQCRREGVEFVFIKSTEGSTFIDSAFTTRLAQARAAGMLVAAYHYVRSNATAAAQVANVLRVVPRGVPVIPDVEANSGGVALVRDFVARLQAAGYRVPVTYLPRWYWQQIGSPNLAGLPSLWSSRYPDNVVGSLTDEYNRAPASYWAGYGGLGVTVLQFTSSARVAGHAPLDANAYLGTRNELAALLGGQAQEDDMQQSEPIYNPATGQPALDINGNGYSVGQALYYDNLNGWAIRDGVNEVKVQLAALAGTLSDDEAKILAAIRAIPAPGDVDEDALAKALGPVLAPLIQAGATPDQVEAAMRRVFASAATKEN